MDIKDIRLTKQARNMFGRHDIDISMADVRVTHGTCFINGKLQRLPKTKVDSVEQRVAQIAEYIRKISGIRDVVLQCEYQEEYFK